MDARATRAERLQTRGHKCSCRKGLNSRELRGVRTGEVVGDEDY